ncbi:MAG: hypothetical protein WAW17_06065, partial [Rhodococcus sp. (in: high G+C Gram-positive bacteria)]|uniref:hypothetical protein n=1 Tax=Rhodococcus sp. TaxID=1831 RepID=UPI003BB17D95
WMLVDLEPGYERLHVGDRIDATTGWCQPEMLPAELVSWDVPVHVERVAANRPGEYDWIAHIDDHVAALLPARKESEGPATISGCLMYDRYLHLFHQTVPTTSGRILRRALITREANRTLTPHGGYSVNPSGPPLLTECGDAPPDRTATWDCVELVTDDE